MADSATSLLRQALRLPPDDRAALADSLLSSLESPDEALDALWLKEAEDRMAAYRSGQLAAIDADQVFAELERKA